MRNGRDGTYVTRRVGKGPHVVGTIATPAGRFRTLDKDVFDRALRSANTTLRAGERIAGGADGDVRKR